mmetsp:Transcript_115106/g.332537  ORF Transcript_115106/g.332537 Transcript_115106/m.332537 type:complete len:231 (+) Transcript_115106:112-804(+)
MVMWGSTSSPSLPTYRPASSLGREDTTSSVGRGTGGFGCANRRHFEVPYNKSQEYQANFQDAYHVLARDRNISKLRKLFELADVDGSGGITLGEFQEALRLQPTRSMFSSLGVQPHQAMLIFLALDKDGNGELTLEEFISGLTLICGPGIDGCRSGEVDANTLRAANLGKALSNEAAPQSSAASPKGGLLPELQLVSRRQLHHAFVKSALSQALHPAFAGPARGRHWALG